MTSLEVQCGSWFASSGVHCTLLYPTLPLTFSCLFGCAMRFMVDSQFRPRICTLLYPTLPLTFICLFGCAMRFMVDSQLRPRICTVLFSFSLGWLRSPITTIVEALSLSHVRVGPAVWKLSPCVSKYRLGFLGCDFLQ